MLADTVTPVNLYLQLRDRFPNTIMLESSDYHTADNSFSFICAEPISSFVVKGNEVSITFPDKSVEKKDLTLPTDLVNALQEFASSFQVDKQSYDFHYNGLFGYMTYEAVAHFEDIELKASRNIDIPTAHYQVFKFVIAINHFKDELFIFEHSFGNEPTDGLDKMVALIRNKKVPVYSFSTVDSESSNLTDAEFLNMVKLGKQHCFQGDVFQIVLSRRFQQKFQGDEFNVYRALRSVNPSPYLFYFDYGSYKIFGSSPEAQLIIKEGKATINPIAGTFRRTGNDEQDASLAEKLLEDPKENAEHVMLVDLARNDLSRNCHSVQVEKYREVQFYSHVIHLVSKVTGTLFEDVNRLQLVADTFPAGTLSGAPKYKAMQLIDSIENTSRSFYGGCIGLLHFNGDFNHAIMIRSFLSQNNTLHFQAGAGVVAASVDESELQEVGNKLSALRNALEMAKNI